MAGINIVGVQFRRAGKIYDFNARNLLLARGDRVVVESDRGPSMAEVMRISFAPAGSIDPSRLRSVLRVAQDKDLAESGMSETEIIDFTKDKVKKLKLDMQVIAAENQLGGSKVIIYFSAPGRVDFRELVRELASGLKTRVELKQIGARDEAKQVGGMGICGREFCCSSFLREFVPVSIKMAKNQNLALNPSKVSGGCGRLLCCLTYEDETYSHLRQQLPPRKARVKNRDDQYGTVIKTDILNQMVYMALDSGEQMAVPVNEIEVLKAERKSGQTKPEADTAEQWGDDLDVLGLMEAQQSMQQDKDKSNSGNGGGRQHKQRGGKDKRHSGHRGKGARGGGNQRQGRGSGGQGKKSSGPKPPRQR